ncbi:hypothetical protein FA15DRAFT_669140 [Coprinopsis marcescibilis]|uniref:Uncharacterized protein n=1 Tax=Coprinopsis marcescibilis TaxID=230819 RepID=A0A5C3KWN7_COPMA|nr:hypothetical protein FA15DRAFT_669140 [Coprinopsis marcescibilis]
MDEPANPRIGIPCDYIIPADLDLFDITAVTNTNEKLQECRDFLQTDIPDNVELLTRESTPPLSPNSKKRKLKEVVDDILSLTPNSQKVLIAAILPDLDKSKRPRPDDGNTNDKEKIPDKGKAKTDSGPILTSLAHRPTHTKASITSEAPFHHHITNMLSWRLHVPLSFFTIRATDTFAKNPNSITTIEFYPAHNPFSSSKAPKHQHADPLFSV